jgi:hypothetical protein
MTALRPLGGGAGTPAQLAAAKTVLSDRSTELADVRAAATKWQAGLAGIAGGITLFAIVKSRTDITGLASGFPALTVGLLALGLALSVAGALYALRASNGMPRIVFTSEVDLYTDDHLAAVAARKCLRLAVWCTILSLTSFACALGLVWLAPQANGPQLSVIPEQGDTACGTVTSLSGTQLVLKTSSGPQTFDLGQLRAIAPVASCP